MKFPIRKIISTVKQTTAQVNARVRKPPVHQPASDENRINREMDYARRIGRANPRLKVQEVRRRDAMQRRPRYGR